MCQPNSETPEEGRDDDNAAVPWVECPDGSVCHPNLLRIGLGRLGQPRR